MGLKEAREVGPRTQPPASNPLNWVPVAGLATRLGRRPSLVAILRCAGPKAVCGVGLDACGALARPGPVANPLSWVPARGLAARPGMDAGHWLQARPCG